MHQAGILIRCGTDAGVPFDYHRTVWREMDLFSMAGFRPGEVLWGATLNNAKILGIEDKTGSPDAGRRAS
jgi:imidazolonepropionase-like amidohydrolase